MVLLRITMRPGTSILTMAGWSLTMAVGLSARIALTMARESSFFWKAMNTLDMP